MFGILLIDFSPDESHGIMFFFLLSIYSHETILPQRMGLRRGSKGSELLLDQLVAFALIFEHFFIPHPDLFIEYTPNP